MEYSCKEYASVKEFVFVLNSRCRLVKPITMPGPIMLSEVEVRSHWQRCQGVGLRPLACWDCVRVRIPPIACLCEFCVLSGRGPCDELISRPEETYRLWCV
jgi:hypothetical protein